MSETKIGVCNICEAICGIELTVEGDRVISVRGNDKDPLSRGHICPKGVAIGDLHTDPDRLRKPVKRVSTSSTDGDPEFVEIPWDEAYDLVADKLAETINTHGLDALGVYVGNPNAHSLGWSTHGVALLKALRTRNRFSASSVDQIPHQFLAMLMFGHQLMLPIPDIDRTSFFLVMGGNPMASNGSLMTVPDFPNRLRALKKRGGKMVVIDPRRTETAKQADEHFFVTPASDAFVVLAMLHVLFADGLDSPTSYVDNVDIVRDLVADFTPELAEEKSGIPAADIRRLTHEYAAADGAAAYGRLGLSTQGFGSICQWAINCLNILSGNLDREGGLLFPEPAVDVVQRELVSRGHYDAYRSRVRNAPEFGGELPVSVFAEEIETPGDSQIRSVLTVAGNPVLSTPSGDRLGQAFDQLDFMACVDIYINETTRHADVILPPTSSLERDHYDLIFHNFAVRNTARFTPAVFDKPRDSRHDHEIFRELLIRLHARLDRKPPLKARLMQRLQLSFSPTFLIGMLLRTGKKTTITDLRKHPEGVDLGPLRPTLPGRLKTKNKRIDLAPSVVTEDLARLRTWQPTDDLVLIGRRHQRDNNSWLHNVERLTKGKPRHQLMMHPDDLAERDLTDGQLVQVKSRVGAVQVEVTATDDMRRGVVCLPHGYGHGDSGMEHAQSVPGVSINDLTDPERLDLSGNAALNGVPVTVSSA